MVWRSCRGLQPHGKKNDFRHPRLSGTEPSTKGYTWFQPKMRQKKALMGISWKSGLWSGKDSIEAPTKETDWGAERWECVG